MNRHIKAIWMAVLAVTSFSVATASADVVEDLTTNQTLFEQFGAFVQGSNFEFTSEGLDIDIPASGDSFGGASVAAVEVVDLSTLTALEVTARLDAGNGSPLILAIREDDGSGGLGEFHSFSAPASAFTEGEFVTVSIDPTTPFFIGDTTNGVLDGILNNTSIQSPFGGTASQNFTVSSVNFVGATVVSNIPEPGTLGLLALGMVGLASRRRR
jgi:hypothetical protein